MRAQLSTVQEFDRDMFASFYLKESPLLAAIGDLRHGLGSLGAIELGEVDHRDHHC
jgi:hypothetical protein